MAGEWIECTLADACSSIDYGLTASASDREVGHRFLRITDIVTGHIDWNAVPYVAADEATAAKYRLHDGDIVLARTGASTGASAYVQNPPSAVFASYLVRLQAKPSFDSRFLAYYLRSEDFWTFIRGVLGDKSAQPNASASTMTKAPLRAPKDKGEQRAIAHILGTLDDKIDLNRRMSETLEAMARALFKSWFVDFDPVRAKAEGRDPGLPKLVADLFPDFFEDSELGEIPMGWEATPLPDAIEVNPARQLKKGDVAPYLDMANMSTRGHTPDDVVDRPFGSGMRFKNGDTLVARITPCLENGKTAYVDFLEDGQVGWGSTEYIVLRPKAPLASEFAYCLARSTEFREFAIQSMTGSSGRQRVPAESLSHFLVVTPSKEIAARFGQAVGPLFLCASNAARESRALASLRDTLLPKLISGELRIEDPARFLRGGS
jgi:type I restriction enzyme S subunit